MSGCFFADLHLFSPRSVYDCYREGLRTLCKSCDLVVLGGDIFDLRWTSLGSHVRTIEAAQAWIEQFCHDHIHAKIVYLLGNHDSHPDLVQSLLRASSACSNFHWSAEQFRLGDCLFLHGDVLNAGLRADGLTRYRRRFHNEKTQSRMRHGAYDVAVALRLHKYIPHLRHSPQSTCRQLFNAISMSVPTGVAHPQRVFFGHTHVRLRAFRYGPMEFNNPGAAIKHIPFSPIKFSTTE